MITKNLNLKFFFLLFGSFFLTSAYCQTTFEIRHTANTACTNVSYTIYDASLTIIGSGNIGSAPSNICNAGVPAYITYTKCGVLYTLNVNSSQMVGCNPTCSPYNDNVTYVAGDPMVDPCNYILTINL